MKHKKRGCAEYDNAITVALAGNPNVGKSTLFNSLTGMHAHTGNWAGKTVGIESGSTVCDKAKLTFVDIPGTYSLYSHSEEERIARDYICFGRADVTVVVCDGCALKQNLNLVLQILETGRRCIVAVNLMDEAHRRGVEVDTERLEELLGVSVVGTVAHKRATLVSLTDKICSPSEHVPLSPRYPDSIEESVKILSDVLLPYEENAHLARWLALRLIDADEELQRSIFKYLELEGAEACEVFAARDRAVAHLRESGLELDKYKDLVAERIVVEADRIADAVTKARYRRCPEQSEKMGRLDRFFTGRVSAYPVMLALLALVFFLTLYLANYPSELLSRFFTYTEEQLFGLLSLLNFPPWLKEVLLSGVYRTLGQVVAVMLPPMVIFFPMFSLLEDSGYLPRVAYNLDKPLRCAGACGKQALTMCMGFGCNAVGIVGCRIIDSRRERLLAILTNSLVPCNGRLPMLVTLITALYLFFTDSVSQVSVALTLSLLVVVAIAVTFLVTFVLSRTLLRGESSSFTIELPPYRRPRFFSVIFRSLTDKCASVLLRAITVAVPVGLVIWVLANVSVGGASIISHVRGALDPVGRLFGMDGAILIAFILGIPANEIVIPILLLIYSSAGAVGGELGSAALQSLLINAGWTPVTAVCTAVFALFHWPCSTSLITVYKETKSVKATVVAFAVPTAVGLFLCLCISLLTGLFI